MVNVFKNDRGKLRLIKEKSFKLEREIQKIVEENLQDLFNLELIRGFTKGGEFELNGLRLDSLCFDKENESFVVIEYKRDKNFSVIDQGFAYLSLLLNNKAEFVLLLNNKPEIKTKEDVDWSQTKVIFIAPQFTEYQKQSINFRDLPIELYEITQTEDDNIAIDRIRPNKSSETITKVMSSNKEIKKIQEEVKVYEESDHLIKPTDKIRELYENLKNQLINLGQKVEISPQKKYIAFKSKTNFVDVKLQKDAIKCHINMRKGELSDPNKVARDVSNVGHHGNGDYEVILQTSDELPYFITLIKQSYLKNS